MNCGQLVHKWNEEDRDMLFEILFTSKNPIHHKIGKDKDVTKLMFIDIFVIQRICRRVKIANYSSYDRDHPYTLGTNEEFERAKRLLKMVNKHIQD